MSFNTIDLNNLKVTKSVKSTIDYAPISDLSTFPTELDKLKEMEFSSAALDKIGDDLKRYYELLQLYLSGNSSFSTQIDNFKSLTAKLSKYNLSSSDYSILRDSLIEISNYLKLLTETELYGEEGVYTKLQESINNFIIEGNTIINEINNSYSQLENDPLGKLLPIGSINEAYLNNELKDKFNYIKLNHGIYVDRTIGEEISLPVGLQQKPIVIKITE